MNNTEQKPLQNIGQILEGTPVEPLRPVIPDLSSHYTMSQNDKITILNPSVVTAYHKITFLFAKTKKCLDSSDVSLQTELPLSTCGTYLSVMKKCDILTSVDRGVYSLRKNFLNMFQLKFGQKKTQTLLNMFYESGIDISDFDSVDEQRIQQHTTTYNTDDDLDENELSGLVLKFCEKRQGRLRTLNERLETLYKEIDGIETEQKKIQTELDRFKMMFPDDTTGTPIQPTVPPDNNDWRPGQSTI